VNIRSLTRGDGVVIGAAVLLFIASFLDFVDLGNTAWDSLGTVMSIYVAGIAAAALIVVARGLPRTPKIVGMDLGQFGVALSVFVVWTALWTLIDVGSFAGAGLIIGFIAALILAGAAIATPLLPALKPALIGAPKPQAPTPYGGQPQAYGYPGQQPYGAQPGQPGQPQPYGAQPSGAGQPGAYAPQAGGPAAGQPQPGQPSQGGQPSGAGQPSSGGATPAPSGDFAAFWFAVPVARPLYGEDGSPSPIAELAPGTWYLAVEQRGPALVAQTQDGRRGVLQDTSGIQRG
jgi:hypothetical protein